jgi:hypothetical protein
MKAQRAHACLETTLNVNAFHFALELQHACGTQPLATRTARDTCLPQWNTEDRSVVREAIDGLAFRTRRLIPFDAVGPRHSGRSKSS